jgi:hypothetical protein
VSLAFDGNEVLSDGLGVGMGCGLSIMDTIGDETFS